MWKPNFTHCTLLHYVLKYKSCIGANFVVIGSFGGCRNDNLRVLETMQ